MRDCPYATYWVDAVIRTAYSITDSWRKRYVKGRARKIKPRVKRRFTKCKITLIRINYERKIIKITIKPEEHLEVSWDKKWFTRRVEDWRLGEVVLKDDRDSNELSLDGFSPITGFVKVNLRPLQSMKIVYEKKATAQSENKREIYEK